jgi:hypothetical protein
VVGNGHSRNYARLSCNGVVDDKYPRCHGRHTGSVPTVGMDGHLCSRVLTVVARFNSLPIRYVLRDINHNGG